MTEVSILYLFLGIAFALAPVMANRFFLKSSRLYSRTHAAALIVLFWGLLFGMKWSAAVWPLFCLFGFFLYLKQEGRLIFSGIGLASCIPFAFSLISATWFFAGVHDLHLLGYGKNWSFYAALHGCVLGWFFVGCLAYLSKQSDAIRAKVYLVGCYLCFLLFLSVAFGIDGVPFIKRIGVIGFSILVPVSIGLFLFDLKKRTPASFTFAAISFLSIATSMSIAVLNEFWPALPKVIFGLPLMTLTHGFINVVLSVPCFYLAIRLSAEQSADSTATATDVNVVFFDGLCVLCNGTVARLLRIDRRKVLRYSSLQGDYARKILDPRSLKSVESVVFLSHGHLYEKSEAVVHILMSLGGPYAFAAMLLNIFPLFIRNGLYDIVARNRYRLFGKRDVCLIPTHETKNLFIS